ncbi:MAG: BspA family leucine-rich repeat surface protein [Cyclobacteriaceae bacterium]|nr:BspA family leucine-rich repeat surface protein [Cyclobacteriaceae bacterium]
MKKIRIYILGLFMLYSGIASAQFITTWKTDNPGSSNDNQITIPTFNGETYLYDIYWEEVGNPTNNGTEPTGQTGDYTVTFPSIGTYRVEISGTFPRIYFNGGGFFGDDTDFEKMLTVEQWGNIAWSSMNNAFSGCTNLRINATDAPNLSTVTDLSYMFRECEVLDDNLNSWDVSTIITMTGVFYDAKLFNQPLNSWDVSSVTDMSDLFRGASTFNQPLNNWNVSNVTNMDRTFSFAEAFNNDITTWEVTNVTNMNGMFGGAFAFNQDISYKLGGGNMGGDAWNTANVTNMGSMFSVAYAFNQDISNWNTSSVTYIVSIFSGASAFNYNISSWDLSGITSLSNVFKNATAFNQDLSAWNAIMGGITDLSNMFEGATAFNQDLSGWNVISVLNMNSMFANTTYNQDITGWSVDNVSNFAGMFENNTAFNQDISANNWDIASANDLRSMFAGATAFDQDLGGWNVSNVTLMFNMLNGSGLSVDNYDKLLTGWALLTLQNGVNFGASNLFYCAAATARAELISTYSWFITDAGLGCIEVFKGNDTTGPEIFNAQPEAIDFGSINLGGTKSLDFTIENKLAVDITNFNVAISTNTGVAFSVTTTPPNIITAGTPLTISIDFTGLTVASFSETVTLTYNPVVGLSSTFSFDITGIVTLTPEPEIAIFEGNSTANNELLDAIGSFYVGGALKGGANPTNQLLIENKGSADLIISGITLPASVFTLGTLSFPITLTVGATQLVDITLDASLSGNFSETLTINSDDDDEPSFEINLNGNIDGGEILVIDGTDVYSDPRIFNLDVVNIGSANEGTDITKQFSIYNDGPLSLSITGISISDPNFTTSLTPPVLINAFVDGIYSRRDFEITLDGSVAGNFSTTVTITSDDDSSPTFTFTINGVIAAPNPPKMYWTESSGFEINRSNIDGSSFEQYFAGSAKPRGIALDVANQTIYWSTNFGDIWMGSIDAIGIVNPVKIIDDGTDLSLDMGGISLDLVNNYIYWASGYSSSINRADLNAADPNTTIQTLVSGLNSPYSVAVDPIAGKIYYTYTRYGATTSDPFDANLASADLDGSNSQVINSTSFDYFQDNTYYDVKISPSSNKIYWSAYGDVSTPTIFQADLAPFGNVTSFNTPADPKGIAIDETGAMIYWANSEIPSLEPAKIIRANIADGSSPEILLSGSPNIYFPDFIELDTDQSAAGCTTPPTTDAGSDVLICSTDNVNLSGSIGGGATSSLWTTSGDGVFSNANLPNAVYTAGTGDVASGLVTLTLTANAANCTPATDQMVVAINLPIAVVDQPATVNVAESITIDVFSGGFVNNADVITTTLLTQPQKGTVIINSNGSIEYTALEGFVGADSFDFQVENQCNAIASATVNVNIPNTAPSFNDGTASAIPGAPVTINITDLITDLNGNIDLSSIEIIQQPGSGAPATLDADNNLVVDYTGMIFFGTDEVVIRVYDTDGAFSEASIFITVEALPIEAYNAVSPNGDGRHDFLEFRYIEAYPENEVKVFNRWGDVVFTVEGYNNTDKTFTGSANFGGSNELPTGTYYYTVTLKVLGGEVQTVNGYFELRR